MQQMHARAVGQFVVFVGSLLQYGRPGLSVYLSCPPGFTHDLIVGIEEMFSKGSWKIRNRTGTSFAVGTAEDTDAMTRRLVRETPPDNYDRLTTCVINVGVASVPNPHQS